MRPRPAGLADGRHARPFDFVVAGCAVLAFGAVLYASTAHGKRAAQFSEAEARLGRIHQAMVAYGEDFDVWDEFPGWGRVSKTAVSPVTVRQYLEPGDEEALWSPAHRPGWRKHAWWRTPISTSHYFRKPSANSRGVLFSRYQNTLEEALARREQFAVVVDSVFDMEHYFPVEQDQSKGAVLVELEVGGATRVTRREGPRLYFSQFFGPETRP